MSIDKAGKAKRLLASFGGIDDFFLEEAESADIVSTTKAARKRVVQYSALGAGVAASLSIVAAVLVSRPKRAASNAESA